MVKVSFPDPRAGFYDIPETTCSHSGAGALAQISPSDFWRECGFKDKKEKLPLFLGGVFCGD